MIFFLEKIKHLKEEINILENYDRTNFSAVKIPFPISTRWNYYQNERHTKNLIHYNQLFLLQNTLAFIKIKVKYAEPTFDFISVSNIINTNDNKF
jgi:hypothetical protein